MYPDERPAKGSSPLAREHTLELGALALICGLIPARAGSTGCPPASTPPHGAHPRSRGEHRHQTLAAPFWRGSSPLTRGAPPCRHFRPSLSGLIPARAGSTHSRPIRTRWGSSPLARGALGSMGFPCRPAGLIPARAGSTGRWSTASGSCWAHPRSRGEHACTAQLRPWPRGSSPLARGAHLPGGRSGGLPGLIPARAGSTISSRTSRGPSGAHPRSRGEHRLHPSNPPEGKGSSPLARGARTRTPDRPVSGGLIPARAGSTSATWERSRRRWAHPRSRGEHTS